MAAVNARERLRELARIDGAPSPVVSVYLNTRWADEQQRERTRVFLKNELARARAGADPTLAADLDWIEEQGDRLVQQAAVAEADGVVLFACGGLGLREMIPLRVAVRERLEVGDAPCVRGLVEALEEAPAAVVLFIDAEHARLIPVRPDGLGEEVRLESVWPGHHRRGGWALLAQARYQRHLQDHRDRHFGAVAEALRAVADAEGVERIVLAGDTRNTALFREALEPALAGRVAGAVAGSVNDPAAALVGRAAALLGLEAGSEKMAALDRVLTEAAKGGRAVAGVEGVLDAAHRSAVHRLYLLRDFRSPGRRCTACGALAPGETGACRLCGRATRPVELGEGLVRRVLATGGAVETVEAHGDLARVGGLAARLRYPV